MATITAAGVGSGLDVGSIVSQLMAVERAPIIALDKRVSSQQSRLSIYGQVKGALSSLQTAAEAIGKTDKFAVFKANVADSTVLNAAIGTGARAGSYSIDVNFLAQAHKLASAGFSDNDAAIDTGTLTLEVGQETRTITIDGSNNTLAGVRDAINAAKAGVTATIINDGSANPARLVVTADDTGASNTIKMSGIAGLEFDPATGTGSMEQKVAAQDAQFEIDGIPITRSSNTVADAIEGVTLTLNKLGTSSLAVQADNETVKKNIEAFVKAYNDVNALIRKQSTYDATSKTAGTLTGDSTMRAVLGRLRTIVGSEVAGSPGGFGRLSELGINLQTDGSLKIDSAKLDAAMKEPTKDISGVFGDATGSAGIAASLSTEVKTMLASDGLVTNRTDGINATIKRLNDNKAALEVRMTRIEARLRAQFTALDMAMGSMNATSQYLTQQLSALASMNK